MTSAGIAYAVSHFDGIDCSRVHDIGQSVPVPSARNLESPTMRTAPDEARRCVVTTAETPEHRIAESIFAEVRPWLFGIACRMVGDDAEAEDIVQEAWIRWQNCDRSAVRDARAFLAAATSRLASNAVQSARARHETYIHTWLWEPVDPKADPALAAERGEAIEFAMRLTLEKLSPTERAAYVLRHAFDYPYARIAEITHQTQASVRQHVSRARKHLAGRKRSTIRAGKQQQLVAAFVAGAQDGNLTALEQLFAADVSQKIPTSTALGLRMSDR